MDRGGFQFQQGVPPVIHAPHLLKLPNKRQQRKGVQEFALEYKDDMVSTPVLSCGIQTEVLVCKFCMVAVVARSDRIKDHLRSQKHIKMKGDAKNIDGDNGLNFQFPIVEPPIFRIWSDYCDSDSAWRKSFAAYQIAGHFTDVTLASAEGGKSIKCHKVILSACSAYFYQQLLNNPCEHPIIILKDTPSWELEALVNFFYHGEVFIKVNEVQEFVKTATQLGVVVRGVAAIPASYCHTNGGKGMGGTNGGNQGVVEKELRTMKRKAENLGSGDESIMITGPNTCDGSTNMLSGSTSGGTRLSGAPKRTKMSKKV